MKISPSIWHSTQADARQSRRRDIYPHSSPPASPLLALLALFTSSLPLGNYLSPRGVHASLFVSASPPVLRLRSNYVSEHLHRHIRPRGQAYKSTHLDTLAIPTIPQTMLATALLALAGSAAASPLDLAKRGPERSLGWKLQVSPRLITTPI